MTLGMDVRLSEEMDSNIALKSEMMETKLMMMDDLMNVKLSRCTHEQEGLLIRQTHALNVQMELLLMMINQFDKPIVEMD